MRQDLFTKFRCVDCKRLDKGTKTARYSLALGFALCTTGRTPTNENQGRSDHFCVGSFHPCSCFEQATPEEIKQNENDVSKYRNYLLKKMRKENG